MADVWGLMPKSQTDPETIEEAIARLISVHEADETSHLGAGESLQSHKASEIIDHLASSIVLDKLADFSVDFRKLVGDSYMLFTCFENEAAWNGIDGETGYVVTLSLFGALISTGYSSDYWVTLSSEPDASTPILDFSKNSFFQTTVKLGTNTGQLAYIVAGEADEGFGFKIVDGTLYAYHKNGAGAVTTEVPGISVHEYNVYRAIFDVSAAKIYFYVNGTLVATHSADLPSGSTSFVFTYYLQTKSAAMRYMRMRDLIFSCER